MTVNTRIKATAGREACYAVFEFPLKIPTGRLSPPGWPPASADRLLRRRIGPERPPIACYTSPFPPMLMRSIKPIFCLSLLLFFVAGARAQQTLQSALVDAGNDFVQEIISRNGLPGTLAVSFENLSSLSAEDQQLVKSVILGRFRGSGVRLVKAESAAAEVLIALSEDWQGYVWVANIKQNGISRLVIKHVARVQRTAAIRTPTVTLQKLFSWSQDSPMLDFVLDGQTLLVLEPEQVAVYATDSGRWKPTVMLGIAHELAWPRDLRGRLVVHSRQITVFLPGTQCAGTVSPPQLQCHASDDPWQLDAGPLSAAFYSPARNFFTGVLAGQNAGVSVPGFFSATAWQSGDTRQWLFTGNDGRARLYQNNLSSPASVFNDWGSDLVAVHSSCGSGWQVLMTPATNNSLQAVEIANRDAMPVSSTLELSGAVRALWPSGSSGQVHGITESSTGKYEAFALSVSCSQ